MEKLPEDFKKKWLESLRSGEYEQGQRSLCENGKYCCLGVAYRVAKGIDPIDTVSGYIHGNGIDVSGIPEILVGTGSEMGINPESAPIRHKLIMMNDAGKSFVQIADYIESNL